MDARLGNVGPGRTGGFTVVELVVAIVVLAIGILGLAGTTGVLVRQVSLGDASTERAAALQTVVERIRATPFEDLGAGADTIGRYRLNWWIADDAGQTRMMKVVTVGPGLGSAGTGFPMLQPRVADTLSYWVLN